MPDRRYRPIHNPPTVSDRFLANSFSAAVGALSAGVGVQLVIDALADNWASTVSLEWLPPWALWALAAPFLVGGLLVLWGALTTTMQRDRAWKAELAGWPALVIQWVAYAIMAGIGSPVSTVAPLVSIFLAIGGAGRFLGLRREYAREARIQGLAR